MFYICTLSGQLVSQLWESSILAALVRLANPSLNSIVRPYVRIAYIGDILLILRPYLSLTFSAQFPDDPIVLASLVTNSSKPFRPGLAQ
jgi:hypothetical protein